MIWLLIMLDQLNVTYNVKEDICIKSISGQSVNFLYPTNNLKN